MSESLPTSTFWMVWRAGTKKGPAFQHTTRESAESEAQRLAEINPGKDYHVLQSVSVFRKPDQ